MENTSYISCPTCSRGTNGTLAGTFRRTTVTVTPCQACTDQGISPWRVRQSEAAAYLPVEPVAVRHADGLVWLVR